MERLSRPDARLKTSFLEAMVEFVDEGRSGGDSMVGSDLEEFGAGWRTAEGFAAYVARTLRDEEVPRRPGFVRQTTWWWVDGDHYIGRISVRHELTEQLREVGGHIGYDVRRTRRREGHATRMLAAVLPEAARLGIDRALITCDVDNVASRKVIEANGGELDDRHGVKLRYWVPTTTVAPRR